MSDERKERRPLDVDFPGEEQLSHLYREEEKDLPPAALDAAILDAARQAAHSRRGRVYFFPSRKWLVPLSLAAALWVTLEIVMERRGEITIHMNAPSAPGEWIENDAAPQLTYEIPDAPPTVEFAPTPPEEEMLSQRQLTAPPIKKTPQVREREQAMLETRAMRGIGPAPPLPHPRAAQPFTNQPRQDKREGTKEKTATAAEVARLQAETAPEPSPQEASDAQKSAVREFAAPTAPPAAGTTMTEARKEQALSPKAWLTKIKELRRAGKYAEAEESLKAFKQRYPGYPVEKILEKPLSQEK